jgi:hypothetical protein
MTHMKITNWGMFLLGVYLVVAGLSSFGVFFYRLYPLVGLLALAAGVLIIMDHYKK